MQNCTAAATHVAEYQIPVGELRARELHVGPRTAAADGDNGRMLAEQDNDASVTARQSVVGQPTLQREAVFEIDDAKQVDVDRKFGREPAGGLLQAVSHSFFRRG